MRLFSLNPLKEFFLSSVYSESLNVSCHPCLMAMHCALIFCLPWNALICLFILKDNFAGYASLDPQLVCFRALNRSFHASLAFRSIDERPNITWMLVPLCELMFYLLNFLILILFYIFDTLPMIWCREALLNLRFFVLLFGCSHLFSPFENFKLYSHFKHCLCL